ncbi:MAG: hypothetical protein HYX53_11970 [Chloroflexi bacterium]|nr:hypothetical protein [Chloroflexota bacterium]
MYLEDEGVQRAMVCLQCGNRPANGSEIADRLLLHARINSRTGVNQRWPFRAAS